MSSVSDSAQRHETRLIKRVMSVVAGIPKDDWKLSKIQDSILKSSHLDEKQRYLMHMLRDLNKSTWNSSMSNVAKSLAMFADKYGKCFPSIARISDETRLSERHVSRTIAQLEKTGIIKVVRHCRMSNQYEFDIDGLTSGRKYACTERK